MDLFGKVKQLIRAVFQKDGQTVNLEPSSSSTYTTTTTIELPADASATQELVGKNAVQTVTNKKLDDNTTSFVDTADATKAIKVDVVGSTTATTTTIASTSTVDRTITLPDAADTLVGKATTDTLTNKTIDADNNTITEIEVDNLKAGVLVTDTGLVGNSNTNIPSTLAVKTYVDDNLANQDDASEITFTPTIAADWPDPDPTTVQGGLDDLAEDVTDHITDTAAHGTVGNVVGTSDTQTLTNKTIDADNNTVSELEVDNLKTGVLITDTNLTGASNSNFPSTTAIKTYVDNGLAAQNEASEITYSNATSGMVATDVQTAIDEVEARVDTTETNIASNTNDVADIRTTQGTSDGDTDLGTFTGTTILDNSSVKAALQALETGVEANGGLATHISDTTTHGTTSDIVGTSDAQTLTAKVIVVADNTITTAASGNLVSTELNAALAELQGDIDTKGSDLTTHEGDTSTHGVTEVVGTSETQILTNKDVDGGTASNASRLTLPKDTTANLNSLTDKEGTVAYDTTLNTIVFNDGAAWNAVAGGSGGSTATPDAEGFVTSFIPDVKARVRNTSSAYLIADTDGFDTFNITGNTYTITLPTLADNLGRTLTFKKRDNNGSEVTIDGEGAETIEGSGNYLMYSDNSVLIVRATSTGWVILYDYDEVVKSLDNQFTGGQVTLVKSGGLVNLFMNQAATHSASDSRTSNTGLIPTKFRPIGGEAINLYNFSGSDVQRCRVTTTGAFALNYVDWAGGASNRTVSEGASLSYVIT